MVDDSGDWLMTMIDINESSKNKLMGWECLNFLY